MLFRSNSKRPKSPQSIIPENLNLLFYEPIEQRANSYRDLKTQPAFSLNEIPYSVQGSAKIDKKINKKINPAISLEKAGNSKVVRKLE